MFFSFLSNKYHQPIAFFKFRKSKRKDNRKNSEEERPQLSQSNVKLNVE